MDNLFCSPSELLILIILYLDKVEIYANIFILSKYWYNILSKVSHNNNKYIYSSIIKINKSNELYYKNLQSDYYYTETLLIEDLDREITKYCNGEVSHRINFKILFYNLKSLTFSKCSYRYDYNIFPNSLTSMTFNDLVVFDSLKIPSNVRFLSYVKVGFSFTNKPIFEADLKSKLSLYINFQEQHNGKILRNLKLIEFLDANVTDLKLRFNEDFEAIIESDIGSLLNINLNLLEFSLIGSKNMMALIKLPIESLNILKIENTSLDVNILFNFQNLAKLECMDTIFNIRNFCLPKTITYLVIRYSISNISDKSFEIIFQNDSELRYLKLENIQLQNNFTYPPTVSYFEHIEQPTFAANGA